MNGIFWGLTSSLGYGVADFIARFTGKALGSSMAVFGVFLTGSLLLTGYLFYFPIEFVFSPRDLWLLPLAGISNMLMLVLLFTAIARGPISIAAPIVASHPALVLVFLLVLGESPNILEVSGLFVVVFGVIFLSRQTSHFALDQSMDRSYVGKTILIAMAANVAYALQVITAQQVAIDHSAIQSAWTTRFFGLIAILIFLIGKRERIYVPVRWWPIVIVHGSLDAVGVLSLVLGSEGSGRIVATVISSTFSVITVLLARIFIKESVSPKQWVAITIIILGVAIISGSGFD